MKPEVSSIRPYREWLLGSLYAWLEWRGTRAEDDPNNRNLQSAKALYAAARDVADLADDDPRLMLLARLCLAGDDAVHEFLEDECRIIACHGFGLGGTQTTDELLSALVKAADDSVLLSLENAFSSQGESDHG